MKKIPNTYHTVVISVVNTVINLWHLTPTLYTLHLSHPSAIDYQPIQRIMRRLPEKVSTKYKQ